MSPSFILGKSMAFLGIILSILGLSRFVGIERSIEGRFSLQLTTPLFALTGIFVLRRTKVSIIFDFVAKQTILVGCTNKDCML